MGVRIVGGIVGFVVLVLLIQSYVLGGGGGGNPAKTALSGAAPTATLPAQLPDPIVLGSVDASGGSPGGGGATTGGGTYVVKAGDTLGSIAASFNVAPEAQAAWIAQVLDLNGIADARLLQAGQELMIPAAPAAAQSTPAGSTGGSTGASGVATTVPSGEGVYIVVSGDTPLGIAEKFCVDSPTTWVNDLMTLNGIDPSALRVGQELQLPDGTPAQCSQ
jgi:LysM repeat protein